MGSLNVWPVLQELLPSLHGRRVVDLGGDGSFARWVATRGAATVMHLDASSFDGVTLPDWSFDLVYSAIGFDAILARALAPGGRVVFSTEHRTIASTINLVVESGLFILRVEELASMPDRLLVAAER